ncbi:hypothetical protein [Virgibacillus sp. DJP39]|uniref:hypothetical protein n=1 Tax=Virgibacillus sp. DJP39 TaxID=3409790 RepID=UPI003BB7B0BB
MDYELDNTMMKFLHICKKVIPKRVSIITNYGAWEDRIVMKGPHLKVSVRKKRDAEEIRIRVSDERGMTVEVPCEGVEIVEVQKTKWDFEAHIYFFTFEGFARINIIGKHLPRLTNDKLIQSQSNIRS